MNVFLYIVTIVTFLLMVGEKNKGIKDTYGFVFASEMLALVAFNLLKGVL